MNNAIKEDPILSYSRSGCDYKQYVVGLVAFVLLCFAPLLLILETHDLRMARAIGGLILIPICFYLRLVGLRFSISPEDRTLRVENGLFSKKVIFPAKLNSVSFTKHRGLSGGFNLCYEDDQGTHWVSRYYLPVDSAEKIVREIGLKMNVPSEFSAES